MAVYSKLVFPFRALSFFSLYLALNMIFYDRKMIVGKYIFNRIRYANISSPSLPSLLIEKAKKNIEYFPDFDKYNDQIFTWCITGDVFLVFLFVCMILGFLTNKPSTNFVIGGLHFIAVVLCTHLITQRASFNFMICAVAFGILLPSLIEIFNLISILCFKNDYYVQSK
ncbi:hypothetical protein M9Y10_044991 [Tritrichomonas musculus]|uniref:Transmembrane protein 107 n=1 Tax=Tritrichomonas musculus TaxID=1915356 RepID=A0ABR2JTZ7_9EUKA